MKSFITAATFGLGASAAALHPRSSSSCFSIEVSGGYENGCLGQLDDGQNRVGPGFGGAEFCISGTTITDAAGRGCIVAMPQTQFQCDLNRAGTPGFSITSAGLIEYNGTTTFYECAATADNQFNIYTTPGGTYCHTVTLSTTNSTCAAAASVSASSAVVGAIGTSSASTPTVTVVSTAAGTTVTAAGATITEVSTAGAATITEAATCSASTVFSTVTVPTTVYSTEAATCTASTVTETSFSTITEASTVISTQYVTVTGAGTTVVESATTTAVETEVATVTGAGKTVVEATTAAETEVATVTGAGKTVVEATTATATELATQTVLATVTGAGKTVVETATTVETEIATQTELATVTGAGKTIVESTTATQIEATTATEATIATETEATTLVATISTKAVPTSTSSTLATSTLTTAAATTSTKAASTSTAASSTSTSASACAANLAGAYQTPHLIVPVNSSAPTTAYGTQYFGDVSSTVSTLFNFDIPSSYKGDTCSLIFLLPLKADLETSSYTTSGSGGIEVFQLSSAATEETTYDTVPSVEASLGTFDITEGSSTVIVSTACAAGETVTYEIKASGTYALYWFEDWNPSPLGLFIREC